MSTHDRKLGKRSRRGADAGGHALESGGESVAVRVVHRVAEREGVEPYELPTQLYEVVDPDALNELFTAPVASAAGGDGVVEFRYCGYFVSVDSDGRVSVSAAEE